MNESDNNPPSPSDERFVLCRKSMTLFVISLILPIAISLFAERYNPGWSRRHPEIWVPSGLSLILIGFVVMSNLSLFADFDHLVRGKFQSNSPDRFAIFGLAMVLILLGSMFLANGIGLLHLG
ncbi:MAG: hypothetical protein K8T89_10985 [Planctomycetes bacterium]|nr:hypothetical protein [Planctomycetota bacterium]